MPEAPGRKACPGLLVVCRQDVPPIVHWECPACGSQGAITGWEDTHWDCSDLRELPAEAEPVRLSLPAHAALLQVLGDDPRWHGPLYTSVGVDGMAVLFVTPTDARELCPQLLAAAINLGKSRLIDRFLEVIQALAVVPTQRSSADAFVSAGVLPGQAVAEALADCEVVQLPPQSSRRQSRRRTRTGARTRNRPDPRSYQIKVSLKHVRPPIWRRLLVPAGITLPDLHEVLQIAMGWYDCHLHLFEAGDGVFAPPSSEYEPIGEDSRGVRLSDIAPRVRSRLVYEYDFGDGWSHEILVEKILDEPCPTVLCLAGKRACPPEDCVGPAGYERLRHVLADKDHEEHAELQEWLGGPFAPEHFDLGSTAAALAALPVNESV